MLLCPPVVSGAGGACVSHSPSHRHGFHHLGAAGGPVRRRGLAFWCCLSVSAQGEVQGSGTENPPITGLGSCFESSCRMIDRQNPLYQIMFGGKLSFFSTKTEPSCRLRLHHHHHRGVLRLYLICFSFQFCKLRKTRGKALCSAATAVQFQRSLPLPTSRYNARLHYTYIQVS
ncbi:hypothetical protein B0T20DRAFT_184641 [Sordaria brevicollis]|uniref:Uncharacterized protein n=1 Tax=Sordaria brevicollis TaxID=83679 RepID=A0AAE0PFB4_SORBR|nr:hypothetical protein B0T20DRAFT_184641 [Sordaria brevicollis]